VARDVTSSRELTQPPEYFLLRNDCKHRFEKSEYIYGFSTLNDRGILDI
jgi:hypothetical protein